MPGGTLPAIPNAGAKELDKSNEFRSSSMFDKSADLKATSESKKQEN